MSAASKPLVYRLPAPSIRYEFRSTKSLMPPTASFDDRDVGVRRAREEIRAVRLADEIELIEHSPRNATAEREEAPVGVPLVRGGVLEGERGGARTVAAVAAVDRDAELTSRAEPLLRDERRPVEEAWVGGRVRGRVAEPDAELQADGEAEASFDAQEPPLGVCADVADALEVELLRPPLLVVELLLLHARVELLLAGHRDRWGGRARRPAGWRCRNWPEASPGRSDRSAACRTACAAGCARSR